MNRIMIFGKPGSGKSTFALKLHKKTNLPLHHLDRYFYTKNWIERNYKEYLDIQESFVDQETWIIDGNCTSSLEMRYKKADVCIYFNYPKSKCYYRILKRFFYKNPEIKDRAQGCKETINAGLIHYISTFETRVNNKIFFLKNKYPEVKFVEIKREKDLKNIF